MGIECKEDFLAKAILYAKAQWCLDDEEVVREWCERRADADTPEMLVDEAAVRYGLIHATDEVGAARAARQLLDDFKNVIRKEASEAVLAKLR